MITPSKIHRAAGRTQITMTILTIAPRASNVQIELIISILEYRHTPNVAAKKHRPLVTIDLILVLCAIAIASFLFAQFRRSL